jgi:hypothetical protein
VPKVMKSLNAIIRKVMSIGKRTLEIEYKRT